MRLAKRIRCSLLERLLSIAFVLNCDIDFTSQAVLLDAVVPVVTADLRDIRALELVTYFSALNNLNLRLSAVVIR